MSELPFPAQNPPSSAWFFNGAGFGWCQVPASTCDQESYGWPDDFQFTNLASMILFVGDMAHLCGRSCQRRYLSENATLLTIDDLITGGHLTSIHCSSCGHCWIIAPADLSAPHATTITDLSGRLRCSKCGSESSSLMPYCDTQHGMAERHSVADITFRAGSVLLERFDLPQCQQAGSRIWFFALGLGLPRTELMRFPTKVAAKAWFDGPDYQALAKVRRRTAQTNLVIVDGID